MAVGDGKVTQLFHPMAYGMAQIQKLSGPVIEFIRQYHIPFDGNALLNDLRKLFPYIS